MANGQIKGFNAEQTAERIVQWIRDYFKENAAEDTKAVIGISGGKDSSVAAALCVKALGKERVYGVLMPKGEQFDINCSYQLVDHLGIGHCVINIGETAEAFFKAMNEGGVEMNAQAEINTPPRIRMAVLYAVAASKGGRVINTCNLSEDYVGYSTKFGDSAGDMSPLSDLTVAEVIAVGDALGLPYELTHKTPIDGLCGKTDEDNLGFTYAELDSYIRDGAEALADKPELVEKIERMHRNNLHKLRLMPKFEFDA